MTDISGEQIRRDQERLRQILADQATYYTQARQHIDNFVFDWWVSVRMECWHIVDDVPGHVVARAIDRYVDYYIDQVSQDESAYAFVRDTNPEDFVAHMSGDGDFRQMLDTEIEFERVRKEDFEQLLKTKLDQGQAIPSSTLDYEEEGFVHAIHHAHGWPCGVCQ